MANQVTATTPILKPIRESGSTFYTFSGAVNDSLLLFTNQNIRFSFSKFVCLKLPKWEDVTKQRMYRDPKDLESLNDTSASDTPNAFLTKAMLQNYTENFSIIADAYRNDDNFANVSESALWKSLINVSRNPADKSDHSYDTIQFLEDGLYMDSKNQQRTYFTERDEVINEYERVVKYVGDINMLNHVKSSGKEYMEVYCHIPTGAGEVDRIQFKANEGLKYPLASIPQEPSTDWIQNQEKAYTDSPASDKTYTKALYDTEDKKYSISTDKDLLQIDWETIEEDTFKQAHYNKGSFDFNAVLIYYDVWDKDNQESTIKRNLYGILFMDSLKSTAPTQWSIPTLKKYQPDSEQAGNAFGIRLNAMMSNSTNQLTTDIVLNDYNTVSMELYLSALGRIQQITDKYDELHQRMLGWGDEIEEMKQYILSSTNNNR